MRIQRISDHHYGINKGVLYQRFSAAPYYPFVEVPDPVEEPEPSFPLELDPELDDPELVPEPSPVDPSLVFPDPLLDPELFVLSDPPEFPELPVSPEVFEP